MPSSLSAATILAAIVPFLALCQGQPANPCNPVTSTTGKLSGWLNRKTNGAVGQPSPCASQPSSSDAKSGYRPYSGSYSGAFLARPNGVMGPITWQYVDQFKEIPRIFWNPGIVVNGNASMPPLFFAGDNAAVQDGQGRFFLNDGGGVVFRITVSQGRYDVAIIDQSAVPRNLLRLDGSKPDADRPAAAATVSGSLQVKVNDAAMARQMLLNGPGVNNDPSMREGVRIATITYPDNSRVTVYQTGTDKPEFWRLVNDPYQGRLFKDGQITALRRTPNATAGQWDMLDLSGQKTGIYVASGDTAPAATNIPAGDQQADIKAQLSIDSRTPQALRGIEHRNPANPNPEEIVRGALLRLPKGIMRHVRQDQGDEQNFWRDEDYPNTAYNFASQTSDAPDVYIGKVTILRRDGTGWKRLASPQPSDLGAVISAGK